MQPKTARRDIIRTTVRQCNKVMTSKYLTEDVNLKCTAAIEVDNQAT